jgi:5-methylcytosine-specific restriction endonuclease McrA
MKRYLIGAVLFLAYIAAQVFVLVIFFTASAQAMNVPDPHLTPGATRTVTLAGVCVRGSAGAARAVPESVKRAVYASYGIKPRTGYCKGPEGCEIDHLISLELGGDNVQSNLWPQPYDGVHNAHDKDKLENTLHAMICAKPPRISMHDAQTAIRTDWIGAYNKFVVP